MAKVTYLDPIAYLSGRVSKKHSQVIYNHRQDTGANYTSMRGERQTEPSASELAKRDKFRVVSAAVRARLNDATATAADKAAFKAQHKYPTFRGYLFATAWNLYDAQTQSVVWD